MLPDEKLLTRAEVARLLYVDPTTVSRWARGGKLSAIRLPSGHRRYREADILAFYPGAPR